MGVHGLTSFVNSNPQLLTRFNLYDSNLVVDGNGLCHKLYRDFVLDPYLGGNYDAFRTKLLSYFSSFAKCRIRLHVLFDGAYDVEDRKLETTMARAKQRLNVARKASRGVFGTNPLLPILALDVLRDVLIQLSIEFSQSDFEADEHIAALANRLCCPVLSQDSDFYIYPLTHGYIQLDSLGAHPKARKSENGSCYLETKIYKMDNLLNCFPGLDRQVIPILAVLMGNDFICRFNFDAFFNNIRLPKKNQNQLSRTSSNAGAKVIGLLQWLQHMTLDEAISKIVAYVKIANRSKLETAIRRGIQNYVIHSDILDVQPELISVTNEPLPKWFCQGLRSGQIPALCLNVALKKRVFLLTQIEDWSQPNSYVCARKLRQYLYGLILQSKDIKVTEYGQIQGNFSRDNVEPVLETDGRLLPSLDSLPLITEDNRRLLLINILGIVDVDHLMISFSDDFVLFLCVIVFWIKSSSVRLNASYLCSLILTSVTVYCVTKLKLWTNNKKEMVEKCTEVDNAMREMCECVEERKLCLRRWKKYSVEVRINNCHPPDLYNLHCYAELQACLLCALFINRFLLSALPHCQIANFLNGTLIYNAYQELKTKSEPFLYLEEILAKEPCFYRIFSAVCQWIMTEQKCEKFIERNEVELKIRKKKRKRSQKKKAGGNDEETSSEEENIVAKFEIACEVRNKYGGLVAEY